MRFTAVNLYKHKLSRLHLALFGEYAKLEIWKVLFNYVDSSSAFPPLCCERTVQRSSLGIPLRPQRPPPPPLLLPLLILGLSSFLPLLSSSLSRGIYDGKGREVALWPLPPPPPPPASGKRSHERKEEIARYCEGGRGGGDIKRSSTIRYLLSLSLSYEGKVKCTVYLIARERRKTVLAPNERGEKAQRGEKTTRGNFLFSVPRQKELSKASPLKREGG